MCIIYNFIYFEFIFYFTPNFYIFIIRTSYKIIFIYYIYTIDTIVMCIFKYKYL